MAIIDKEMRAHSIKKGVHWRMARGDQLHNDIIMI